MLDKKNKHGTIKIEKGKTLNGYATVFITR